MEFINKRRLAGLVPASAIVAAMAVTITAGAVLAAPHDKYDNGFEKATNVATPETSATDVVFNVTRVEKSKDFKPSKGHWYATAGVDAFVFSRVGGYNAVFPTKGYATSVDIYLDMAQNTTVGTDLRFDWSSAISNTSGGHARDFIFNVGTDPVTAGQFVVSASNNAPGWPSNPDRDPFTIAESGWYTFQHEFKNVDGVLVVDMSVLDARGHVLHTWTLSTATDLIGSTIGGNRYVWLASNDFDGLAIDEVNRSAKGKH